MKKITIAKADGIERLIKLPGKAEDLLNPKKPRKRTSKSVDEVVSKIDIGTISVNTDGNATSVKYGDTLQMQALVRPDNASNKSLVWSVVNTEGQASIDPASGLLTGTKVGSVTIVATSQDGSGKAGSLEIEIVKQDQEKPQGLSPLDQTKFAGPKGSISGTSLEMEYKLSTGETWIKVTGPEITGLDLGDYNIRYSAKEGHNPGASLDFSIQLHVDEEEAKNAGFVFDLSTGAITGYVGSNKDIIIPHRISGSAIVEIGENAFYDKGLTSLKLPTTLTAISGEKAFYKNNIRDLIIPALVTTIGRSAFSNNSINKLTIEGNSLESIGINAFTKNSLTSLTLPSSVTTIEKYAFSENLIRSLIIPDSLTKLENHAFYLNSMNSVTIHGGVDVGSYAFNKKNEVGDKFKPAYDIGGAGTYIYKSSEWTKAPTDDTSTGGD